MSHHGHLQRLVHVWEKSPVYFITTGVAGRRPLLAGNGVHAILHTEWSGMRERHGWEVGRYVVMPDHVHFFVAPMLAETKPLSNAIGKWKEWTAKRIKATGGVAAPIWQPAFFDHLLRSKESREAKWNYVCENPVRAGLVRRVEDWPYAGSIDFE